MFCPWLKEVNNVFQSIILLEFQSHPQKDKSLANIKGGLDKPDSDGQRWDIFKIAEEHPKMKTDCSFMHIDIVAKALSLTLQLEQIQKHASAQP